MYIFRSVVCIVVAVSMLALVGCDSGGGNPPPDDDPDSEENAPPEFTAVPQESVIEAGSTYEAQVEAADPDDDEVTFSFLLAPDGAEIASSAGQISWAPTVEQADSTYSLEIEASDGEATVDTSFALTVEIATRSSQITLDPSVAHQEMVGFGGALTWYSDQITSSSYTEQIADLLFEDLGTDILRLKNWYYPANYPENKTPDEMEEGYSYFKPTFDATNEFYDLVKQRNEDIDILLSSWGPPSALKSNGELEEGTLAKDSTGSFRYGDFAQYWVDILDHISFTPEYISIQNEPDYVNPGWETSEWRPTETSDYPGYEAAIDSVYERLQERGNPPAFIGPEAANLQSFPSFAEVVRDKPYVDMYGYHVYNFSENTPISSTTSELQDIPDNFGDKPNIMTEYSGMSWMKTAQLINNVVVEANASGYIYWEMWWGGQDTGNAMARFNGGEVDLTPFYYVMKHFAKHVDEGYERIDVSTDDEDVHVSGYKNPAGDRLTLVIVNPSVTQLEIDLEVEGQSVQGMDVVQSTEGNFYQEMGAPGSDEPLSAAPASITTVVFDL